MKKCLVLGVLLMLAPTPGQAQHTGLGHDSLTIELTLELMDRLQSATSGAEVREILEPYLISDPRFSFYDNCAEQWPATYQEHEACTDLQAYAWNDTVSVNTQALIRNWNTFTFTLSGTLKVNLPPPDPLAFQLVITDASGNVVYDRMTYYQVINETWSFGICLLCFVYTQEVINLVNPVPGTYTMQSIMQSTQFNGHTVTLNFEIIGGAAGHPGNGLHRSAAGSGCTFGMEHASGVRELWF